MPKATGTQSVSAIVLAGGKTDPAMRAATGVNNRALVELTPKRAMLDFVIDAVRAAPSVGEIAVVGDVPQSPAYKRLTPGETFLDNLLLGVSGDGRDERPRLDRH